MYLDRRLWAFTRGVRLRIAWAVLVGLVAVAAGIARLALLGWLLARVFAGDSLRSVLLLTALVAVVILVRGGLEYYRNMVAHRTAALVQAELRRRLYEQIVALGPAHFTQARTGEVILSMVEGVQQLEVYFGQYLPQLVVAALTPLLIFAFVAFVDLPIALVFLLAALLTLLAPALWHASDSRRSLARQNAYGAFAAEFLDSIQGLATLKAFGQSAARAALLATRGRALFQSTMWVLGTNTLARGITDTGMAVGAAVALGLGAYRVAAGEMELAALLIVLMLGVEVFRPLRELRVLLHQGMLGISAAQGIFMLLDARPVVRDATVPGVHAESVVRGAVVPSGSAEPGGCPVPAVGAVTALAPTVAFEAVTFAYPGGRQPAHEDLSFAVAAGERVGIVGPSGSGKSTIAKLLLRFYDPQRGRVVIGGRDLRELALDQARSTIAVVNQDTYLFHGTVEDNLRMGKPDATPAELEAAARAANAHDFIARLPQGYQTVVGERGVRLSGGQRQRIAIARALLRDAPLLILDEALSSVDSASEAVIQEALDRLMEGRTTLIFAHRLSSVIGADRILALADGRLVESGTHRELMTRRGAYYELMAAQAQDGADGAGVIADPMSLHDREPDASHDREPDDERDADAGREVAAHPEPTDAILRAERMGWRALLRILLGMIRGYRGQLAGVFLLGVARVTALIGVGVMSSLIVLAVKHGEPFSGLLVALGIVAPLAGILHWVESWFAHDMAYRLLTDMRVAIFQKLDALAPAYLTRRRTGDLVSIATHDVELIEYFFAHTITPAFVAVLVPVAVLVTLAAFGWPMATVLLPFLAYAALSPLLARGRIDRLGSRAREVSGELNAHAVDSVQGLGEIVAFQQARAWGERFAAKARDYLAVRMPFLHDLTLQTALQEVATGLGGLAVLGVGAWLAVGGKLDPGILPLLTLLAMSAFVPVWEIAQVGRQLADTLGATRRVHAVHTEAVPVTDGPGVHAVITEAITESDGPDGAAGHTERATVPGGTGVDATPAAAPLVRDRPGVHAGYAEAATATDAPGARRGGRAAPLTRVNLMPALEMSGVRFTYPGRTRPALSAVSFAVPAGGTVALVGPSGAGKTTVAHLFLRFWDPSEGVVKLNGHDLRAYRLDDLRRHIALVAQDTYLFNQTLRENILIARPAATEADVGAAVANAALTEFVASLLRGLDTVVGERGTRLSGGQRQRVAIARAFLKDAPVLILDEATSHLDAVNEQAVREALEVLARNRTTVVIAHRLSTVRHADQIVVLDEGRVVEIGPHHTLVAKGGLYAHLVARQLAAGIASSA